MSSKLRGVALACATGFVAAAGYYAGHLRRHLGERIALDYADGRLPENLAAIAAASNAQDVLRDYRDFLASDNWLAGLFLLAFLCVAWYTRLRSPESRSPAVLAAAAVLYAVSDWAENALLFSAAGDVLAGSAPASLDVAAAAGWSKLGFSAVSAALATLALLRSLGRPGAWGRVLFLDMPALVDDLWRRLEFRFHKERDYDVETRSLRERRWYQKTPLWLFALTALFVAYGPTLDGVCSAGPALMSFAVWVPLALLFGWPLWKYLSAMLPAISERVASRFARLARDGAGPWLDERKGIAGLLLGLCGFLLVAPALVGAVILAKGVFERGWCIAPQLPEGSIEPLQYFVQFSGYSLARLLLALLAVAAFAYACEGVKPIRTLLKWQALLVLGVALGTALLSPAGANEGSGQPYVHVFLVVAPILCGLLCLAPWIAARRLKRLRERDARGASAGERFSALLPRHELFVPRPVDPQPTATRVIHAVTDGVSDRVLQLLIPPALGALMAPADWLPTFTVGGFALAFLISTWGNMSARWQHMVLDVQRWFLRGTALFVSLFVMALAGARLLGVGYVTTILNAAPLGVVFGMVLMAYVLSWLVEYWVNRVVAAELLGLLGAGENELTMRYETSPGRKVHLDVKPEGRYLMVHSMGRFAVVGERVSRKRQAFHSYDLLDLFRALAGEKDGQVAEVSRQTDLYFHAFNLFLIVLALAGWFAYKYGPRYTNPAPVVQAQAEVPVARYFDLAERLLAAPGDTRPALIVAASGGGTRAALYTAHLLEGLHRLGAAGDIALMSGVSGGGVALAYFAANRETLLRPGTEDEWQKFRRRISQPFIEDVLEGATELRVYGAASVSMLLAESFERRLARHGGRWTLGVQDAGLILNTAISGHPDKESSVLEKTLDDGGKGDCDRSYNLMAGGRLVFTNLSQTGKFPQRDNWVSDVRLPYVVVRDPAVRLETAAALNANFPPAFPNARVRLHETPGAPCPERSFFVTDGGAQENLGLVSALYAVWSALDEIERTCGERTAKTHPWCKRTLRPIRFVIAEASAATFDYEEDRGIGAALTAKDRLTGGLTDHLIHQVRELYLARSGVPAAADNLLFDFLALPLAFRARGGLGTHWMHAEHIEMIDPRLRETPAWHELRARARATVTIHKDQLGAIWRALHDPAKDYCTDRNYRDPGQDRETDTVRRWICGAHDDRRAPRDLHVGNWKKLREALRDPGRTL